MFDVGLDIERPFGHDSLMARTYVRRRIAAAAVVATVLTIVVTGPVAALGSNQVPARAAQRTYVVRSGDTLWAIALRVSPGIDPRSTVLALEHENGIDASSLRPGQVLRVSAG